MYTEYWSSGLSYRSVSADDLDMPLVSDTGSEIEELLHWSVSDGGDGRLVVLSQGPSIAEAVELIQMQLDTDGGLAIRSLSGEILDPPIVLVESNFADGGQVSSGDWTVTTTIIPTLTTWYGSMDTVLELDLSGPTDGNAPSLIRLSRDVGPVQFVWEEVAGDLVWYEP